MTGFTPGPWKACQSTDADFLGVYPDTGRPEFPIVKLPDYIKPEIAEANARLIAAAPELLEALRPFAAVMADIGETEADEDTFRNANRAYAKAPAITVGDIRKAAALFSLATGESK